MPLPNFLVIGAPKCGTTSLYFYLKQHPQIYMSPVKEPMFFVLEGQQPERLPEHIKDNRKRGIYDLESYLQLFTGVKNEIALGESSIQYLYSSKAPERIKYYLPHVKMIAIVRDPAERAFSSYMMSVRQGFEKLLDIRQAIQAELHQPKSGLKWWMKRRNLEVGFYYRHLKEYYKRFDSQQIKIYLYKDLKENPLNLMQNLFQFLGVNPSFSPDLSVKHLVASVPKNNLGKFLLKLNRLPVTNFFKSFVPEEMGHRLFYVIMKKFSVKSPSLEPEIRADLIRIFRDDILKLQDLIQRDLSYWLK